MKLLIDPGHGGSNIGTTAGGQREKDTTLLYAGRLRDMLWNHVEQVGMTRYDDKEMSLGERGIISRGFDWTLCIHVNAHKEKSLSGSEVYVLPNVDNNHERLVARAFLRALPVELITSRIITAVDPHPDVAGDWIEAPINVLSPHRGKKILIEIAYASNAADLSILSSSWGQLSILAAMVAAVAGMKKSLLPT